MQQWTCHWSLLLMPLTIMSTVGESYAVIYLKTSSNNYWQRSIRSEQETFLWQKSKLLTIEICWQNLLTRKVCWQNLLTREICWQNLLTKIESADHQKLCWLNASKPLLKTLHHASQAMAGARIPSVKFNACICAWAGLSSTKLLLCRYASPKKPTPCKHKIRHI